MINVPESVQHGTVKMHIISGSADSKADDDLRPDAAPVNGTIILKPTVSSLKVTSATPPTTMLLDTLRCPIIEGILYPPGTELDETETTLEGVILVSSDQPATQPTSLQWKATFDLSSTTKLSPITFNVPVNGVIDLTTVIPAVASPGTVNVITTESRDRAETAAVTATQKASAAAASALAASVAEQGAVAAQDGLVLARDGAETARDQAVTAKDLVEGFTGRAETAADAAEAFADAAEAAAEAAGESASASYDSQVVIMNAHSDVMSAVEAVDQDRQWAMSARAGAEQAVGRADTSAGRAESSADAASGSASAAHDSQVLAVDAKRDAETAAGSATGAASDADLARGAALAASGDAELFAGHAEASAGDAADSAQAAADSALLAAGSASTAEQAVGVAAQHAGDAGMSAVSAADSADVAAASALGVAAPITHASWSGAVTLPENTGFVSALLTGDVTLTLPDLDAGLAVSVNLLVTQDATGGHTLTVPFAKAAYGVMPEATGTPSASDVCTLLWDGTDWTVFVGAQNLLIPMGWVI